MGLPGNPPSRPHGDLVPCPTHIPSTPPRRLEAWGVTCSLLIPLFEPQAASPLTLKPGSLDERNSNYPLNLSVSPSWGVHQPFPTWAPYRGYVGCPAGSQSSRSPTSRLPCGAHSSLPRQTCWAQSQPSQGPPLHRHWLSCCDLALCEGARFAWAFRGRTRSCCTITVIQARLAEKHRK